MSKSSDVLALVGQIEADLRAAWQFDAQDKVYQAPQEIPPRSCERYAVISLAETAQAETFTASQEGQRAHTLVFEVVGSFKREPNENLLQRATELVYALENQIHSVAHYADVSTTHEVIAYAWDLGDAQDAWIRVSVTTRFFLVQNRYDG